MGVLDLLPEADEDRRDHHPASNQLTTKDIVYRCNTARVKMLLAIGERDLMRYVDEATPVRHGGQRALIGPETPGWDRPGRRAGGHERSVYPAHGSRPTFYPHR